MVKNIVTDTMFLMQKSEPATKSDEYIITDLLDTIIANRDHCVGMAANMIGFRKKIIVVLVDGEYTIMVNPEIVEKSKQIYETMESCLSLIGSRPATRHKNITVEYLDKKFKPKKRRFNDFEAQVIQHEIDHFDGILI